MRYLSEYRSDVLVRGTRTFRGGRDVIVDQALQRADAQLDAERSRLETLGLIHELMDDCRAEAQRRIVLELTTTGEWRVCVETPVS